MAVKAQSPKDSVLFLFPTMYVRASLLGLEEENGAVSEVEVDEVFRLVCNKASEIPPYDTMPCSSFARVKL